MTDNKLYFLEALLNKRHKEPLQLINRDGENFSFTKMGVKEYFVNNERILYCVLSPLNDIDDATKDTLLLYRVNERGNKISLQYENNHAIIDDILSTTNI